MAVQELSQGGPDGARLGQSASDLVGFHGATPVAQVAITCIGGTCVVASTNAKLNLLIGTLRTKGVIG